MHVAGGGSSLLLREIVELAPLSCLGHGPGRQLPLILATVAQIGLGRVGATTQGSRHGQGDAHTHARAPRGPRGPRGEEGLVHCPCFPAGLHMGLGLVLWRGSLTDTSSAGLSMVLSARHRQGYFL